MSVNVRIAGNQNCFIGRTKQTETMIAPNGKGEE